MDENLTLTGQKRIFYQAFVSIAFPLKYDVNACMVLFILSLVYTEIQNRKNGSCILLNKMINRQKLENESFMKESQNICS